MVSKTITPAQKELLENAAKAFKEGRPLVYAAAFPAPSVTPVNEFGVLHPDETGIDNVEIVIDYDGMPNNDVLSFYWNGDTTIAPVTADAKPKKVSVPAHLVIAAARQTINVIYLVIDAANPGGVASDVLSLVVEKYTAPVYPAPQITEALDGVLDVSKLMGAATVSVQPWSDIKLTDKLWLDVVTTPPFDYTQWQGTTVNGLGVQTTKLELEKLQELTEGSILKLELSIEREGRPQRIVFPTATYTVKQQRDVKAVTIDDVKDSDGKTIPDGSTTSDTSVTISGTVTYA